MPKAAYRIHYIYDEHEAERADGDERVLERRAFRLSQYIPAPEPPQKGAEQQGDTDFLGEKRKKAKRAREAKRHEHASNWNATIVFFLLTFLFFARFRPRERDAHQKTQSSKHPYGGHEVGARDHGVHRFGMNRMKGEQQGNGSRRTSGKSEAGAQPEQREAGEDMKQGVDDPVAKRVQAARGVVQRKGGDGEGSIEAVSSLVRLEHAPVVVLKRLQQATALSDQGILADDGDVIMQKRVRERAGKDEKCGSGDSAGPTPFHERLHSSSHITYLAPSYPASRRGDGDHLGRNGVRITSKSFRWLGSGNFRDIQIIMPPS